ncbi:alanine racemase [Dellaglioa sp. BT-FLS60]
MVVGKHRPTQILVDRAAIKNNIAAEKRTLTDATVIFAVVKANAYGHGLVEVAKAAKEAGARGFCVAIIDEALALRKAGFVEPILILGLTESKYAPLLAKNKISATVSELSWLQEANALLNQEKLAPLAIHLALDTGMGRIGFRNTDPLLEAIDFLESHKKMFDFEGIFTHFATADSVDETYFKKQLAKFNALMAVVVNRPRYVHVSNSATSLWHAACNGNMIRMGISMYGLNPSGGELTLPYDLKPAMSLTSELSFVKKIQAGDSVGYGITYQATEDEWVGTVPIGYADGLMRQMQGFKLLVDGQFCEIIGRICMDQIMIRLPYDMMNGTKVTLIGQDGDKVITAQEIATYIDTIHYEVTCALSERIPRMYLN